MHNYVNISKVKQRIGVLLKYKYPLPDECPDIIKETITEDRKYYRISENLPPRSKDFLPLALLPEAEFDKRKRTKPGLCKWFGVSVYEELSDILSLFKSSPRLRSRHVVCGIIKYDSHGIVKCTKGIERPSHRDWFPKVGIYEHIILTQEVKL